MFIENFIKIRDAFDEHKLVPLELNDIQQHLHYNRGRKNVTIKSRRQGLSTYFKAIKFANAVVLSGRNVRVIPHDPETEEAFRADFKVMYENLPSHLKPDTKYYSEALIEFKDPVKGTINSRISTASVQPGHEGKGRGQTITDLHLTEPPFWRGDANKAATALTEAAQGGEIDVESTPYGIEWTYGVYQQGKKGEGGWKSFFFEWWWKREYRVQGAKFERARNQEWVLLLPGQTLKDVWQVPAPGLTEEERAAKRNIFETAKVSDKEIEICGLILKHLQEKKYAPAIRKWHCYEVAEYLAWRRQKITELSGGEAQFIVEYPENDIDCFENTGRPVISPKDCKVSCEPSEPQPGREYLIGCDTSRGYAHGDPQAIEIIDLTTGRQAYSEELRLKPDLLAYRIDELSRYYNFAVMAVERNNTGIAVLQELAKIAEEERIFKQLTRRLERKMEDGDITFDEAMDQCDFGIETTAANKGLMASYLERAIRTGEIGLSSKEWCEQAKTVIWMDNGSWGAMPGFHDDRFIALAIANYVREVSLGQFMGFVGVMPEGGYAR